MSCVLCCPQGTASGLGSVNGEAAGPFRRGSAVISRGLGWFSSVGGPLTHRVLRGGFWLMVAAGATRVVGLAKMTLLARLLAPKDFGLMGIAMMCLSWFEYFTQTGFSTALVQKQGDIRSYLDTFWTAQVIRSTLLSAALFLAAPLGGAFFENAEATPLIRALALVTLARGFINPGVVHLRRHLDLGRESLWRFGGTVTGALVAIPLAIIYRNAWALVISGVVAAMTEVALSYWAVNYRPRFHIDSKRFREMAGYGKWIFWGNMVYYASISADSWVVGKSLGVLALGYYQVAQQIGLAPITQFASQVSAVMLPAFSKVRAGGDLRRAFSRSAGLLLVAVVPVALFISAFASEVVTLILGRQWIAAGPLVQLLVWTGVLMALDAVSSSLLQAMGRPDITACAIFLKLLVFGIAVYPLMSKWGAAGVAAAVLISAPAATLFQLYRAARILGGGLGLMAPAGMAAMASAPVAAAWLAHAKLHSVTGTVTGLLASAAIYSVFLSRILRAGAAPPTPGAGDSRA